jgi:hypothetical protein
LKVVADEGWMQKRGEIAVAESEIEANPIALEEAEKTGLL